MNKKHMLMFYRLCFATLIFAAIITQLVHQSNLGNFNAVNFFSFFTIESNIFAALVFVFAAFLGKKSVIFDYKRGAATLYIVMTGIIYVILLSGADVQTPLPWVNATLHYIFPAIVLLDWVIDPPKTKIKFKNALIWLIFPLIYAAYSLIRGATTGWYPYPFLNVNSHGYLSVLANSIIIAIFASFLVFALVKIPMHKSKK